MLPRMAKAPVELIKKVPLFSDLDNRELKEIADSMKERTKFVVEWERRSVRWPSRCCSFSRQNSHG